MNNDKSLLCKIGIHCRLTETIECGSKGKILKRFRICGDCGKYQEKAGIFWRTRNSKNRQKQNQPSRQNASLKWNENKEAILFISILIIVGIIAIVFRIGE
jgi:hypothetical protein